MPTASAPHRTARSTRILPGIVARGHATSVSGCGCAVSRTSAAARSASVSMSHQVAAPTSDAAHQPACGELPDAAAQASCRRLSRDVERREQRRRTHEESGIERVVARQILADRGDRDRRSTRTLVASAATSGVHRPASIARSDSSARTGVSSSRVSTGASNRWSPISSANRRSRSAFANREHRDAVLEVPVGIVGEVQRRAAGRTALDRPRAACRPGIRRRYGRR